MGEIEMFNGQRVEHEVLTKAALHRGQMLHGGSANVGASQFLRQTMRQGYRGVNESGGKGVVHGRGHTLCTPHLNEVIVY
jgi:hypothetical protein